jgi:hypothetical protein
LKHTPFTNFTNSTNFTNFTSFTNFKLNFQVLQSYQMELGRMELQSQLPHIYLKSILILLNSRYLLKTIQTSNWSLWTNSNGLEYGGKFHKAFCQEKERAFLVAKLVILPQVNINFSWVMEFILWQVKRITCLILRIDIMKEQKLFFSSIMICIQKNKIFEHVDFGK